jgi:hypothetical protein
MTESNDAVGRALEVFVFGPIGLASYLKEVTPSAIETLVARGRAEVDRGQEQIQQRVTTARSLGQVAMAFGVPIVRQRVQRGVHDVRSRAETLISATTAGRPAARPATYGASRPAPSSTPGAEPFEPRSVSSVGNGAESGTTTADPAPPSVELPIPGYDALSASQVVERLTGLSAGELDTVRAYEGAHRRRRTILGKIEQLTASSG